MTRFGLAVAVGLVGFSVPSAANAAGTSPAWPYHVASATGSVSLQYASASGGGVDSVTFQGRARQASAMLRGRATYRDQSSQGCGPFRHSKIQNFPRPRFSVQGDFVVVTWNLPLPNQAYCHSAMVSSVAQQVKGWGVFSEQLPLSRFTCFTDSLKLGGEQTFSQGGTMGRLVYQATVTLDRPPTAINVSL